MITVLEALQAQFEKQRARMIEANSRGRVSHTQTKYHDQTHDLIQRQYHLYYDEKSGKWRPTRKQRQRPLKKGQVVEMWVLDPASLRDNLCTRYEGELYNQGQGPQPNTDTHPHCACQRIVVAAPNDKGRLDWIVRKPRNKRKPKIRIPDQFKTPASPYDPDDPRNPQATFS